MLQRRATRISRELTPSEQERLAEYRRQIAAELPDLQTHDQMRKDAREEGTLSGELRRAIHQSDLSLAEIATRVGITPNTLDDFLTGERTLRSDVIDRLTITLGYELSRTE
jgi:ribosome-binding protein aMBF1 (putative translation factor)